MKQLKRDVQEFINKSKYRRYINSVPQSNGNSIEFSLSTQTRSSSKMSQSKFLHKNSIPHLEYCPPWTLLILTLITILTLNWWSLQSLVTSIHSWALSLRKLVNQLGIDGGSAVPSSGIVSKIWPWNWAVLSSLLVFLCTINIVLKSHCGLYMQRSNATFLERRLG